MGLEISLFYKNGLESRNGFYNYALVTDVYDVNTGELLNSAGI